mgnify:CR=1 FL=1
MAIGAGDSEGPDGTGTSHVLLHVHFAATGNQIQCRIIRRVIDGSDKGDGINRKSAVEGNRVELGGGPHIKKKTE